MPLYEYQCSGCANRFEMIQKFSDAPLSICPRCGGRLEKLISTPAIQFKGTGWYVTDYARRGNGGDGAEKPEVSSKTDKASQETCKASGLPKTD